MKFDHQRLKAERVAKGLKQAEVAKIVGVSEATYSRYESGKVPMSMDKFVKAATYFGYTVQEISIFFKD